MSLISSITLIVLGSLLIASAFSIILFDKAIFKLPQFYNTFTTITRQKYQFYLQFIIGIGLIIYGIISY